MAGWKKIIVSGSAAELASLTLTTDLSVANGGTGASTLGSGEVLLGNGTGAITSVARGNITDSGGGKVIVTGGTSAILGTGVTLNIGGNVASGSKLNDISGLAASDGNIIVGDGATWVAESGDTARASLGLGSSDSPTFATLTVTNYINSGTVAGSRITGSFTGSFVGDGSLLTGLPTGAITSYTNAADNRLITSVDATTVNSEANLTFNGSLLEVVGSVSMSLYLTASTAQFRSVPAGVDNTVLVIDASGNLLTDEIDARVWGTTLVDGAGAATRVPVWSDADSLTSDSTYTFDTTAHVLTISGSTFSRDVVVEGNLTVHGTTITLNATNLAVEDQFVLLNSGSAAGDGGIVVQTENGFIGAAFGWDDSAARWGIQNATPLSGSATAIAPEAYVSAVVDVDGGLTDIAAFQKNGNMRVEGGEIFIYS